MDSPAQSLELPTTALTDSTDARKALHGIKQMKSEDLKHTAQQLSDYGVHLLLRMKLRINCPCILNRFHRAPASQRQMEISLAA